MEKTPNQEYCHKCSIAQSTGTQGIAETQMKNPRKQNHGKEGVPCQLKLVGRKHGQGGDQENPSRVPFLAQIEDQPDSPRGAPPNQQLETNGTEMRLQEIEKHVTERLPPEFAGEATCAG